MNDLQVNKIELIMGGNSDFWGDNSRKNYLYIKQLQKLIS